jgi:flagellar assembly protein FliH
LSKESPRSSGASKNFSSLFPSKGDPSSVPHFRVQWPALRPKNRAFLANQALGNLEEQVLKEAKERALAAEKEAYEKGFSQGEKDGLELGFKRLEAHLQSFQKVLAEVQRFQKEFFQKHEKEMVQFLITLVRKILRQDNPQAEQIVTAILHEAFRCVEERKGVQIRLHPKDYEFLKDHPERLPFPLNEASAEGIKLAADPSLLRGGCLIETSFGDIDATLESQLDQITAGIWQRVELSQQKIPGSNP